MPPRTARTPTLEALLPPILANLQSDPPNAYSAHQKALTTTARLVHAGHGALAVEILFAVARELLKLGEAGSGVELGVRMIEIMGQIGTPVDDKSKGGLRGGGMAVDEYSRAPQPPSHSSLHSRRQVETGARSSRTQQSSGRPAAAAPPATQACTSTSASCTTRVGSGLDERRADRQTACSCPPSTTSLPVESATPLPCSLSCCSSGRRRASRTPGRTPSRARFREWSASAAGSPLALPPHPLADARSLSFLAQSPPNVLPASAFLQRFLSLLQSPASAASSIFLGAAPGPTPTDAYVELTTSPTLNFLQLALATVERAPAPGVSGVQARGTDGGVARDWQQLLARYRRIAGSDGVLANPDVNEVSLPLVSRC